MQQRMAESFAENITRYLDFVIEDITSTVYNVLTFSVAYKAKVWNAVGMMLVILVHDPEDEFRRVSMLVKKGILKKEV